MRFYLKVTHQQSTRLLTDALGNLLFQRLLLFFLPLNHCSCFKYKRYDAFASIGFI